MPPEEKAVSQEPEDAAPSNLPVEPAPAQDDSQTVETPVVSQPPAVDEDGIPFLNKYKEKERKLNELYEQMPTIVESLKSEIKKEFEGIKTQSQPKYTEDQLRAFLATDEGSVPQNRVWAEGEISKIREERLAKIIDEKFQTAHVQQETVKKKTDSFNYVVQNYPEAFKTDAQGNILGWDESNPITKMIAQMMQDERLRKEPDGLILAADAAWARLSRSQVPKVKQQIQQLQSEKKQLLRNGMTEGGGRESARVSDAQVAMERLKKSGSVDDAYLAFKALAKK
jgi:hypothetical protein